MTPPKKMKEVMEMAFIRMSDLLDELRTWGVSCGLSYDYDGDGWVVTIHTRDENILIHHGFSYRSEVFASTYSLRVESDAEVHGRFWTIANARLQWVMENKASARLNDFFPTPEMSNAA